MHLNLMDRSTQHAISEFTGTAVFEGSSIEERNGEKQRGLIKKRVDREESLRKQY